MAARKPGRPRRVWFQRLRQQMAAHEMSAQEMGRRMGLTGATISRKLRGEIQWTLDEAHAVMDLLGLPPEDLYLYFPRNGEDVEPVSRRYVEDFLETTKQTPVPTVVLQTVMQLLGGICPDDVEAMHDSI